MSLERVRSVPCVIARGGTSKGIYIKANHLPADPAERDRTVLAIFGSPDRRQIDGLGGADPLTSKLAVIGPPSRPDADVDYTFGQVSLTAPTIDYSGNCGNISSGVGPFAIDEGLVRAIEPVTVVRIHNTNTGRMIVAEVPVEDGRAKTRGDCAIDGVPGTGARIMLDFADTAGAATGRLLPTGRSREILATGAGDFEVSMVDCANAMVFVKAASVGLAGTEGPAEFDSDPGLLARLEAIRGAAAVAMGLAQSPEEALSKCPAFPMLAVVSPPAEYRSDSTGAPGEGGAVSWVARNMFMQALHKTYAGTGSVCTAAAARLSGTVVAEVLANRPGWGHTVNIGHPCGVMGVEAVVEGQLVKRAAFARTARRIMEGRALIPG
jgi:2-methylaconitate cis-trans-isomerase PrpF